MQLYLTAILKCVSSPSSPSVKNLTGRREYYFNLIMSNLVKCLLSLHLRANLHLTWGNLCMSL